MKRQIIFLAILSLFISSAAFAQVKISGAVVDIDTKDVIEFANLALLKSDSTFVSGTSSDNNGLFAFNDIPHGDYILSAAFVGYKKLYIPVSHRDDNTDLGHVKMKTSDIALKDVTVTANAVIQKPDKLIIPSDAQIKGANSGVTLLRNLQLSRIIINPIDNSVTAPGGKAVQLRINGVEVTNAEVVALQPADVIRIEYHDEPGMRYGDAAAVINYITRRRDSGGNISTNLTNVPFGKLGFAEDHFSAKINHKKSEFAVNAYYHHRKIDWTRENKETFVLPSKTVIREEIGEPTTAKWNRLNLALNYSLMETDKYLFSARLRNNNEDVPSHFSDRKSTVTSSDTDKPLFIADHSTIKSNTPSLDLYYQRNLKNEQLIIFNVVGTYIDTKTTRSYKETGYPDIISNITGNKYSLIGEGIYEKGFKTGKLSTGLKHTQGYTRNSYGGSYSKDVNVRNAETYGYLEYQLRKGKFNYTFGMGLNRFYNSQGERSSEKYVLHPVLRAAYNINDNASIRYSGHMSGYAPSLSDMNNTQLTIDNYQMRRGNPSLGIGRYMNHTINGGYNKGIIGAELNASYSYDWDPIMEHISTEVVEGKEKIIRTTINQKSFHRINAEMTFKLKPLKDHLTFSLTPGINRYISNGENFTHTYTNWRVRGSVTAMYKKWSLHMEANTRWNSLWAEDLYINERWSTIMAGYNGGKWQLNVGMFNPFSKYYDQKIINYSKLAPNESYVYTRNLGQIVVVNFSMNLNFGRQYNAANKRLNNDDTDSGIMSGSKK